MRKRRFERRLGRDDRFLPAMVIVGVVGIVAVVSLFLWSGIEGAQTYHSDLDESVSLCTDDDEIGDHYKAGTVRYKRVGYHDYCMNGLLYQFYCQSLSAPRVSNGFKCPSGCLNGVCI